MSKIKSAVMDLEEITGKPADELENDDLRFLETASDRMMKALESQEAQDAQRSMDIENALEHATENQLLAEVKRRGL